MPAPKSSRSSSSGSSRASKSGSSGSGGSGRSSAGKPRARKSTAPARDGGARATTKKSGARAEAGAPAPAGETEQNVAEQVLNRIAKQLDLVMLSRDRIQETLDEAAERGRVTRSDANMLVSELVKRGRQQTDDLLKEVETLIGRGRGQIESATRRARRTEPVDRLVRGADRARRTVGVGPSFPITGYDDLSAGQVKDRLEGLSAPELRKVRDYERRHANRKTVLEAVDRALG